MNSMCNILLAYIVRINYNWTTKKMRQHIEFIIIWIALLVIIFTLRTLRIRIEKIEQPVKTLKTSRNLSYYENKGKLFK